MNSLAQQIIYYVFVFMGLVNFTHLVLYLVGADIYDIREMKRRKAFAATKKKRNKRPLVSVIVPAYNEQLTIVQCVESIRKNSYKKVEIIVHNDCSKDDTAKLVKQIQKKYPKLSLRLINRRKNAGKGAGVNFAIKRYSKGDLIMTLDADCILHKDAIKNAVAYFNDPSIVGVAANVRLTDASSILGLLQKFEHMIGYRSKKFYTVTNSEFIVGGVASTYRRETMVQAKFYDTDTQTEDIGLSMKIVAGGNRTQRIMYAADVLAMTEGVQTFKELLKQRYRWKLGMLQNLFKHLYLFGNVNKRYSKSLTLYRVPMAFIGEIFLLFQPIVLSYIVYLSFVYHTTSLFFGAYLIVTLYVLTTVWADEHMTRRHKISLSFYTPTMYFIFYVMDLVQIIAIFRIIAKPKKFLRRGEAGSWVSPTRTGQLATGFKG